MGWCLAALLLGAEPPVDPAKATFERVCGSCHAAEVVSGMGNTRQGWRDLMNEMFRRGGRATRREKGQILDFLVRNYPLSSPGAREPKK